MRNAARDREQNEQDREAVERRIALPGEADREQSEHRRDREIEPIRAASQPAVAIGEFPKHERNAKRHHEPRQVAASNQERRSDEAEEGSDARAKREPEEGFGEAVACENGRRVGAKAKERRVPKRNDSGQSENKVERQSKQAGDERFVDDRRARRQSEDHGQHPKPEDKFRPPPTRAPIQMRGKAVHRRGCGGEAHRASPRANSPCGRTMRVTTITP